MGQPGTFWITYAFAFVLDQVKSVVLLIGLWYFLLRRCGYLQATEQEYKEVSIAGDFSIALITQLRNFCMQNIETPWFNTLYRYILGFYAGFVLFWISTTDFFDWESIFSIVDIVFLSIFAAELAIRIFGLGFTYLFDFANAADAIIVVLSLIFYGIGYETKIMIVMRLVKILIVIIVKFTGNQFSFGLRKKADNPLAELQLLLEELLKENDLKKSVKAEITWALNVIDQNRLNVMENDNSKLDMYEDMWLKQATGKDVDTKTWFDKDLEEALNEIHRESEEQAKLRIESGGESDNVKKHLTMNSKEWIVAAKLTDDLHNSRFDENVYNEFMKDRALVYLGFKLFTYYDLFNKFGVVADQLASFLKQASASYNSNINSYHNMLAVVGILHNLHYFIMQGNLTKYLTDLDIMALILSGISYCFCHPYLLFKY